jgi:DNA polymerase-3 subunit delta
MQLRGEALPAHIESRLKTGQLAPLYVVSGEEPLLAIEAQDLLRAAARKLGFEEREVLHAEARWDWSQLEAAGQSLSLFSARKLIELRLPSGKPGRDGAEALKAHAQAATGDGVLTVVALPKLDRATRESAWAAALEQAGVWVEIAKVERAELPAWIGRRLAVSRQSAPREALDFIADRVEGNLLAAHQEVLKLGLLYPAGEDGREPRELGMDEVADAVLNVARFDVFGLPAALLAGDRRRALRMLEGLRAEGEALPLILWSVSEEIRTLLRVQSAMSTGRPFSAAARDNRVYGPRQDLMQRALRRLDGARLAGLLARCTDIDRLSKGLKVQRCDSDAWLELADVAVALAS